MRITKPRRSGKPRSAATSQGGTQQHNHPSGGFFTPALLQSWCLHPFRKKYFVKSTTFCLLRTLYVYTINHAKQKCKAGPLRLQRYQSWTSATRLRSRCPSANERKRTNGLETDKAAMRCGIALGNRGTLKTLRAVLLKWGSFTCFL